MRKLVGLACALVLTVLGVIAPASTASAHQGNIKVSDTQCVDGNSMKATYTVGWSNGTGSGKLYTKSGLYSGGTSTSGWDFEKNVSGASGSASFTKTHTFSGSNGPWVAFKIIFDDNYVVGGDTRVEGWDWDKCKPAQPDPKTVTDHEESCKMAMPSGKLGGERDRTGTQAYVWNGSSWVLGDTIKWGDWKYTPYTDSQYFSKCAGDNPGPKYSEWSSWSNEQPTCESTMVTQTRTRTKTTYTWVWNGMKDRGDWVVDEVTEDKETRKVEMSDKDFAANCKPDQPAPKAHTDFQKGCTLNDVGGTATRNGTEAYKWDLEDRKWVLSGKIDWQDWVFTAYTDQEFQANCAGSPEPDKVVVDKGEWVGQPTCDAPSIYQTREVVTTTTKQVWNLDLRKWEWGTPTSVTTTETAKKPTELTKDQIKACHPKDAPTLAYTGQTCTVGDQGVGQLHGGSLTVTSSGWTVKVTDKDGKVVKDLTDLDPGNYTVTASLADPDGTSAGNIDGWTPGEDGTISQIVNIATADDCTILEPKPRVEPKVEEKLECDGAYRRTWDLVSYPVWKDGEWTFDGVEPKVENETEWKKFRELSNDEWLAAGCRSDQPPAQVRVIHDQGYNCDGLWGRTQTGTTEYVWVWSGMADRGSWVLGDEVLGDWSEWTFVRELTKAEKAELGCNSTPNSPNQPKVPPVDEDNSDGVRAAADPAPLIGLGVLAALGIAGAVIAIRRRRQA